jgi:hypothetical protein
MSEVGKRRSRTRYQLHYNGRFFGDVCFSALKPISDLRFLISGLFALLFALCSSAHAQQTVKISRIGILISGTSSGAARNLQAFQQRLRELGYVEGKNIIIEQRYAEGKVQIVPDLT